MEKPCSDSSGPTRLVIGQLLLLSGEHRRKMQKGVRNARSPLSCLAFGLQSIQSPLAPLLLPHLHSLSPVSSVAARMRVHGHPPGQPAVTRTHDYRDIREIYIDAIQAGKRLMGTIRVLSDRSRGRCVHRAESVPFAIPPIDPQAFSCVHTEMHSQQQHWQGPLSTIRLDDL